MKRIGYIAALVVGLFMVGLVTVRARSLVDWSAVRAVGLESDDWGLAGFVPAADSWQGLNRDDLGAGRFPAVYWQSTLEDSATVAQLAAVMSGHIGRDGLPAVFQPNYVMGSLGWSESEDRWLRYDLPEWPVAYRRPGLWAAVMAANRLGVWQAEFQPRSTTILLFGRSVAWSPTWRAK